MPLYAQELIRAEHIRKKRTKDLTTEDITLLRVAGIINGCGGR